MASRNDTVRTVGAPAAQQVMEVAAWIRDDPDAAAEWAQQELGEWLVELRKRWVKAEEVNGINRLPPIVIINTAQEDVKRFAKHVYESLEASEAEGTRIIGLHPPVPDPAGHLLWETVRKVMLDHQLLIQNSNTAWEVKCYCGKDFHGELLSYEKHQRARVKALFNEEA